MDKNYGGGGGDQTRSTRLVDISPFFLVEATGDSEGDFDHRNLMKLMMDGLKDSSYDDDDFHDGNGHDNDYAQSSCCHGNVCDDASTSSSSSSLSDGRGTRRIIIHDDDNQDHHHDGHSHDGHDDAGHDDDDDDDDVIKGGKGLASTWKGCNSKFKMVSCSRHHDYEHGHGKVTSDVMSTANSHSSRKSSSSCADSREGKKMSEKERSRLFWETCLAS